MNTYDVLAHKAYNLRVDVVRMTSAAGSGHPTSCLSAVDIMSVLFFHAMRFDVNDPKNHANDRFILSKGHAAPLLYAAYKELGVLTDEQLLNSRDIQSVLEGHPTPRFEYVDVATGSLGIGLSVGIGMALHARRCKETFYTYVLLGDGELAEGAIWEAAELAAYYKLNNLIAIADINGLGQRGPTMHEYDVLAIARKFEAFGWHALTVDGHDTKQLVAAFDDARNNSGNVPVVLLAKTIKGYGVARAENKNGFHGKAFSEQELPEILTELKKRFYQATWNQEKPKPVAPITPIVRKKFKRVPVIFDAPRYTVGESVSLRKSFGESLVQAGNKIDDLVCLDADVSNSTYTSDFAKKFTERFVECFIAEQAMVGMAMGMSALDDRVLVATFGSFLTRAFDQLRMTAISRLPVRVVGTHVGVEVGQDGPSQMALEDLALFCALPGSIVLYPADAIACQKLFAIMMNYNDGISYLRLTRGALPVIYDDKSTFKLGGFNILRQSGTDRVVLVAAGVTIHEALGAYELLKKRGIMACVIDLYSIKPLDQTCLRACIMQAGGCVVTIEDHYANGGLGDAVCAAIVGLSTRYKKLAVYDVPRSGTTAQLLSWTGIDASGIERGVIDLLKFK